MDPIALIFYALVCGTLGLVAPSAGRPVARMAMGALVGIAAAAVLPGIKAIFGG